MQTESQMPVTGREWGSSVDKASDSYTQGLRPELLSFSSSMFHKLSLLEENRRIEFTLFINIVSNLGYDKLIIQKKAGV
jgi:hypothetical protein